MTEEYLAYLQDNPSYDIAKSYLHFDLPVKPSEFLKSKKIRTQNDLLSYLKTKHSFSPLIHFMKRIRKIKKDSKVRESKNRDLYFASHKDRCIFMTLNFLLLQKYVEFLEANDLQNVSLAYRKISKHNGEGKSNIDFAFEIFTQIKDMGSCFVLCEDIKSFFDELDHDLLYDTISNIVGNDHVLLENAEVIYKQIIKYRYVDKKDLKKIELYRNRAFGVSYIDPNNFRKDFKAKLGDTKSVKKGKVKEIPQGTSLSGTFANIYMANFDKDINTYVKSLNGIYQRYSDDIIVVIPIKPEIKIFEIESSIKDTLEEGLRKIGLSRNAEKSHAIIFPVDTPAENEFLQYLGFELKNKINLRNSTVIKYLSNGLKKYKAKQRLQKGIQSKKKLAKHSSKPKRHNTMKNYVIRSIELCQKKGLENNIARQFNKANRSKNKRLKVKS